MKKKIKKVVNMEKEQTPPLLLMNPSENVTFNNAHGGNLLMPVTQDMQTIFAAADGEAADSFLGQSSQPAVVSTSSTDINSSFGIPPHTIIQPPSVSVGFSSVSQPASNMLPSQPINTSSSLQNAGTSVLPPPPVAGPSNTSRMTANTPSLGSRHVSVPFPDGSQKSSYAPTPPSAMYNPMGPQGGYSSMPPPPPATGITPTSSYYDNSPSSASLNQSQSNTVPSPPTSSPQSSTGTFPPQGLYIPVQYHWCYSSELDENTWHAFSMADSIKLDEVYKQGATDQVVSVDGGRYDVCLGDSSKRSVYWEEPDGVIRRCSWFHKPERENRYVPYDEQTSAMLENEYKTAVINNLWHKRIPLSTGESVVMHTQNSIVQFSANSQPDEWGTVHGDQTRPSIVKRGIDDFALIEEGESTQIDHLVFVVHGIGSTCDLRFRNIVECVNDFRGISHQLIDSHFKSYQEQGRVGRVEFLPVKWHSALHGDATGIDSRLKAITLQSIGKLRHFTNDTLLDILFYSSPAYCQRIVDTVALEMDRLYTLFLSRNDQFNGDVSVAGHSLGSLVLFDLLLHQQDPTAADTRHPVEHSDLENITDAQTLSHSSRSSSNSQEVLNDRASAPSETSEPDGACTSIEDLLNKLALTDFKDVFAKEQIDMETLTMCEESDIKELGLPMGPRKKLLAFLKESKENQLKKKNDDIQHSVQQNAPVEHLDQSTPHANSGYPLFRQSSNTTPISYVLGSGGTGLPLVRHQQLSFTPSNFFALGSPIAMFLTVRGVDRLGEDFRLPTCPGFFNIFHPFDPVAYRIEPLVNSNAPVKPMLMPHHAGRKRMHLELKDSISRMGTDLKQKIIDSVKSTWQTLNKFAYAHRSDGSKLDDISNEDVDDIIMQQMTKEQQDHLDETGSMISSVQEDESMIGELNQSRRIDYVLQEKPIESFNDYLFALGSHGCYWESEDTVLLIMKEIYSAYGIAPQRPGQPPKPTLYAPGANIPASSNTSPPPLAGFGSAMPPPPMTSGYHGHPGQVPGYKPTPPSYANNSNTHIPTMVAPPTNNSGPPPLTGFVNRN